MRSLESHAYVVEFNFHSPDSFNEVFLDLMFFESTEMLNLLGVTIDSKLNFNHHINNVCKKASQRIGVLVRLKNLILAEAKLQLYKAAILPHLTYCHLTWHFCKASDRRKLERIQERGLRAVF